ncbi:MAG: hypothetical protein PHI31_01460 [Desulfuromonadaceae bacterium]|nr:hypothetical protein [Desulfuromonadaceae bacterium]
MQLTITPSLHRSDLDYRKQNFTQLPSNGSPHLLAQLRDRIELSREARQNDRHHDEEHSVDQVNNAHHGRKDNALFDFLTSLIEQISGTQISDLQQTVPVVAAPAAGIATASAPAGSQSSLSVQQSSLSVESSTFSLDGSVTTLDGATLTFALDLQVIHASANASAFSLNSGAGGYNFSFAGSSAELTSTSFSFSLIAKAPDGAATNASGVGTFTLKDDLKVFQHALNPLFKDFLHDAGMPSDNHGVSTLLSTLA